MRLDRSVSHSIGTNVVRGSRRCVSHVIGSVIGSVVGTVTLARNPALNKLRGMRRLGRNARSIVRLGSLRKMRTRLGLAHLRSLDNRRLG